jgi:acyl-CoA thioesterase FadM
MNLLLRFLKVFISALLRPRLGLLDNSTLSFRVLPTDLDFNLHMNNARYLSFMDLGRTDLLVRAGLLGLVSRERLKPVTGSIDIKFRRSLMPFQRFKLHTRVLCWDEKWLYLEQCLESAKGIHAIATVRGLFVGREGSVPSRILLDHLDYRDESPPFPAQVLCLLDCEETGKRLRSAS